MMADSLTKALQGNSFKVFVSQIGLVDVKEQLEQRELREFSAEELEEEIEAQIDQIEAFQAS